MSEETQGKYCKIEDTTNAETKTGDYTDAPKDYFEEMKKALRQESFKRVCPHGHEDCPHVKEPCPANPFPPTPYYPCPWPHYPTWPYDGPFYPTIWC